MSQFFITTRTHNVNSPNIIICNDLLPLLFFLHEVKQSPSPILCLDKEFNSLNELNATPLLTQIGNEHHQFAIDDVSFPSMSYLEPYKDILFVGHFIKIDIKVARGQGIDIRNVYDTGIVEQRLGLDSKRLNNLEAVHERRLGTRMPFKDFKGKTFSTMNEKSIFETEHITYALGDIVPLLAIRKEQQRLIAKFNMFDLIGIENAIIPIIADAELEGFNIDEPKWKANIEDNKLKLITVERELDTILEDLTIVKKKHKRVLAEVTQHNLFGFQETVTQVPQKSKINYSSPKQVLPLFDILGYSRPKELKKIKDKVTGGYVYEEKESIGESSIQAFNLNNPENELFNFINKLLDYKEIDKELSSFGEKFLHSRVLKPNGVWDKGYKNDKTGRVHTIYRQVETTTGRLSSGESREGYYNSQQIPAIKKYRECFILSEKEVEDDWWITTSDLTGAEVTIMCAFAKDKQLYKWAIEEDDLHSPMATLCWREVARQRVRKNQTLIIKDTRGNEHKLDPEMVIDKKGIYSALRTDFKNGGTFGVVYGAKENTVSRYFNIYKHEGAAFIDVMKSSIPDTFKMVEEAAKSALENGYLIFNTRTNSRKYFAPCYQGYPLSQDQKSKIEGEARNAKMQGTQADMVKEAISKIDYHYREQEVPNKMLLTIHDELVWKHKGKENGAIIPQIMGEVGTLYLEGFTTMKAHETTTHSWVK